MIFTHTIWLHINPPIPLQSILYPLPANRQPRLHRLNLHQTNPSQLLKLANVATVVEFVRGTSCGTLYAVCVPRFLSILIAIAISHLLPSTYQLIFGLL